MAQMTFEARGGLGETVQFSSLSNPTGGARDLILELEPAHWGPRLALGILGRVDLAPPMLVELTSLEQSEASSFLLRARPALQLTRDVDVEAPLDYSAANYSTGSMGHLHFVANSVNSGSLGASKVLELEAAAACQLGHLHRIWSASFDLDVSLVDFMHSVLGASVFGCLNQCSDDFVLPLPAAKFVHWLVAAGYDGREENRHLALLIRKGLSSRKFDAKVLCVFSSAFSPIAKDLIRVSSCLSHLNPEQLEGNGLFRHRVTGGSLQTRIDLPDCTRYFRAASRMFLETLHDIFSPGEVYLENLPLAPNGMTPFLNERGRLLSAAGARGQLDASLIEAFGDSEDIRRFVLAPVAENFD